MTLFRTRFAAWITYSTAILVSCLAAFALCFTLSIPKTFYPAIAVILITALAVKGPIFYLCGVHRNLWTFADFSDLIRLLLSNAVASAGFSVVAAVLALRIYSPRFLASVCAIDFLICFFATLLVRYARVLSVEA